MNREMEYGNYPWLDEYLLALPSAEREYQSDWEAMKYMIREKMFAMLGENKEKDWIITVKLEPAHGEILRKTYGEDIGPGYYMNKTHWNSIKLEGNVPDEVMKDMLSESHGLILGALPKKIQKEILAI